MIQPRTSGATRRRLSPRAATLLLSVLASTLGVAAQTTDDDSAAQCPTLEIEDAAASTGAAFLVLRHEKKGPDHRPDLAPEIVACQKRWRGSKHRDQRVVLQDGGVSDARATGAALPEGVLQPAIFHSQYCRALETAFGLRDGARSSTELIEVPELDLGTGNLRRALERVTTLLAGNAESLPVVLVTHKDRFGDLGLDSPLQGGGYVLDRGGRCLAKVPSWDAHRKH